MMNRHFAIIIRHENPAIVDDFDRTSKEVLEAAGIRDFRRLNRDGNWCHYEIFEKISSLQALKFGNRISRKIGLPCHAERPWQSQC